MALFSRKITVEHRLDPEDRALLQSVEMHLLAVFDEIQDLRVSMNENRDTLDGILMGLEKDYGGEI